MTAGTNQPDTLSARRWIGARQRCASATSWTICDSMVSAPTRSASITSAPVWLSVPPITRRAGLACHGHGFTRDHGFVDRGAAIDDDAIDRHLLTRTHAQTIADHDRVERNFCLAAIADAPRRFRRQIKQRPDRAAGAFARPQFQHLPKQHEHGDDGGSFEIDRDQAVRVAELWRKSVGAKQRDNAVCPGDARAERDQREHVEIARLQRCTAAREERPTGPQHHRRREDELHPGIEMQAARSHRR